MTALLALLTVAPWGIWIPLAQIVPGIPQRTRTFYVALGNLAFATPRLRSSSAAAAWILVDGEPCCSAS